MVECGTINEPPSFSHITVWGIITMIIMAVVGIESIYGAIDAINFKDSLLSLLLLIGSGFGVAGLIFAGLALWKSSPPLMKTSGTCFLISCLVSIAFLIFSIIKNGFYGQVILQIILDVFLCYLFFVQSNSFSSSG